MTEPSVSNTESSSGGEQSKDIVPGKVDRLNNVTFSVFVKTDSDCIGEEGLE